MQQVFYEMLEVIHEYSSGIGGFSIGCILLTIIVLAYKKDYEKNNLVNIIIAVFFLVMYPFHAFYIISAYGIQWYGVIMCLFPVLPIIAYSIYLFFQEHNNGLRVFVIIGGVCIFVLMCSFDNLNFNTFKFSDCFLEENVDTSLSEVTE